MGRRVAPRAARRPGLTGPSFRFMQRVCGRHAGALAVGAVMLFFVAALIEGFFRQLVTDVDVRTAVIAVTALGWLAYFGFAGRRTSSEADLVFAPEPALPAGLPDAKAVEP